MIFEPRHPSPYDVAILTPAEMAAADLIATNGGVRRHDLMKAAGQAIADAVKARWPKSLVCILCGPGNNGGDGFAAARQLVEAGWPVRIASMSPLVELPLPARHHVDVCPDGVEPLLPAALDGACVVVDAMFGSGLSRSIEGVAREVIEALKVRKIPTCAVDIPSGVDGATGAVRGVAAPADVTVTYFRKKPGHLLIPGKLLCGPVVVADIGIPSSVLDDIRPQTFENGRVLWIDKYPWPRPEEHKYQRGHALVLGGAMITGASRLSALGALRTGAGLVTLAASEPAWSIYATSLISIIVRSINGLHDFESLLADRRRNAIAIGPGAGVDAETRQYALAALTTKRATVLDADAITSFEDVPHTLFRAVAGPTVLTPHEGEFRRVFNFQGDKLHRTRNAAQESNAVVLLKGADTVIAAPDGRAIINSNAPPQLATAGSGDVLTGIITGLLAQGLDAFEAAAAAAWLHGEAAAVVGLGLIAEDLPDALPEVIQNLNGDWLRIQG